jgi:sugar lactone lactonase YvrE
LPGSVALDSYGSFYIPDSGNNRIRKVDTSGYITTVAGNGTTNYSGDGGAASNASLNYPMGVAVDGNGNLLIADYGDNRIRKVLLSAGHPVYTLSNTSTNNAGNYSVVVSSPYGSVTSSVVTLTVTLPPQIIASGNNFGIMGSQFGFNVSGTAAQTIIVQASTNLVDWTPLSTNILEDGLIYFSDPATTNFPWRFYRAMSP